MVTNKGKPRANTEMESRVASLGGLCRTGHGRNPFPSPHGRRRIPANTQLPNLSNGKEHDIGLSLFRV